MANNKIVAKFNDDLSKIEFYNIITEYKHYTIIEKQTFDAARYYIYDSKTAKLGLINKLHKKLNKENILRAMNNNGISWLQQDILFFWADSRLVTEFGEPRYELLVKVYEQILGIRKIVTQEKQLLKQYQAKSLKDFVAIYWKILKHRIKRNRFLKEAERELKIIW